MVRLSTLSDSVQNKVWGKSINCLGTYLTSIISHLTAQGLNVNFPMFAWACSKGNLYLYNYLQQ